MPEPEIVPIDIKGKPAVFTPANATIQSGDSVFWVNKTNEEHQPVSDSDAAWVPNPIKPGKPSNQVGPFNDSGTFGYKCKLHNGETGTITVS